jgi:hypothetical protein
MDFRDNRYWIQTQARAATFNASKLNGTVRADK